jgi:hypothetical protein
VVKRLTIVAAVLGLGLALGGCSKCGFIWDEWQPRSCKSDAPR